MNITKLQDLCDSTRTYWDYATNRHPLSPQLCANGEYFVEGYLIFDMDTLDVWSFPNCDAAIEFLQMRYTSIEAYPVENSRPLSFYNRKSLAKQEYFYYGKASKRYQGKTIMSHFDACHANRYSDYWFTKVLTSVY